LGQIDLSDAISRERQRAEETICRERQRAEQADARAREVEEENAAMLEEIEYLQSENEELQRQVSDLKAKHLVEVHIAE
jgi:dynactin complex subunit